MNNAPANEWRLMRRYFQAERVSYAEMLKARPEASRVTARTENWFRRTAQSWQSLNNNGVSIPSDFLQPYSFPKQEFLPANFELSANSGRLIYEMVQPKYQLRAHNVLREFDRWHALCPEIMQRGHSCDILELSSGGCGGAEVVHHFGHNYQATDFLAGRGSVYAPIHASLGLAAVDFDGSKTPYGFGDKSYDYVACFQAIDAYGDEEEYPIFIDEMLRIARQKVILIFNPGLKARRENLENGTELLIQNPLADRYPGLNFMRCPSTGMPAAVISTQN
jgi:hypothetical protein